MYKSFAVSRFRCFPELKLDSLERVNLIAGENNVGKTALLEALFLHSGPTNPALVPGINRFRGMPVPLNDTQSLWQSLFHNFDSAETIELASTDASGASRLLRIFIGNEGAARLPIEEAQSETPDDGGESSLSQRIVPGSLVFEDNTASGETRTTRIFFDGKSFRIEPPSNPAAFPGIFLVAGGRPDLQGAAERYGKLAVKKMEGEVVTLLRILEPRLQSLAVIPVGGVATVHGDVGLSTLVPIPLMGRGMVRLFSMAVAVASAERGVMLIDEIENGIYHGSTVDIWKAIGAFARRCDTQLFCTTHSFECIQSAHTAFEESEVYDFRLHRLERAGNEIHAVTYDQESLAAAIESGLEVR